MTGDPRIDRYAWQGGTESMLRFGPEDGPVVLAALPLFEEANRTRTFLVAILRLLAAQGIGSVLPDLPATGDSLVPTVEARLADMRAAHAALAACLAAKGPVHAVGLRSAALLDMRTSPASRWHLAPQGGEELLADLARLRHAKGLRGTKQPPIADEAVEIAGNHLSAALIDELGEAVYERCYGRRRVVRLDADPRPADRKLPGLPLWRRAEPGYDPVLAQRLAEDIQEWVASCAG